MPTLDSSRPLPAADTIPPALDEAFDAWARATDVHLRPNAAVQALADELSHALGLHLSRSMPTIVSVAAPMRPLIDGSVHWRGGDKLKWDCKPSAWLSWCVGRMDCLKLTRA